MPPYAGSLESIDIATNLDVAKTIDSPENIDIAEDIDIADIIESNDQCSLPSYLYPLLQIINAM